jgi:hypothetical protein
MQVFIDTSGFKALVDPQDDFHQSAAQVWEQLAKQEADLVTSNYILDETFTLLRARCGLKTCLKFRQMLQQSSNVLSIYRINIEDERQAWHWFTKDWSKLSYTDCVSFALMERLGITQAVSFDQHFKRAGFNNLKAD